MEITGQLNSQGTNTSLGRTGVLSAGKYDCGVDILNMCWDEFEVLTQQLASCSSRVNTVYSITSKHKKLSNL